MLNPQARTTYFSVIQHIAQVKKIREIGKDGDNFRTFMVRVNDVDVQMEADSCADVKLMDEHQFKALIH